MSAHYVFRRAPLTRRMLRLVRRSPVDNARLVRRAVGSRVLARLYEVRLAQAAHTGRAIVAGPFLGEIGFELLYWLPFLRRTLANHGIPPEQVTVLTRGGAAEWYADIASNSIELLDLVSPEQYWPLLRERRERAGDAKQLTVEELDRRIVNLALERLGEAIVLHPIVMYSRLRSVWAGVRPAADAMRMGDYRPLPPPQTAAPPGSPPGAIAFKAYFSEAFPDSPANRMFLEMVATRLSKVGPVILLGTRARLDDHREWEPSGHRLMTAAEWLEPRTNLAVQSALIARSRALVATYGGFSYLGPFYGIPTLAFSSADATNPVHRDVLASAFGRQGFVEISVGDDVGLDDFLRREVAS